MSRSGAEHPEYFEARDLIYFRLGKDWCFQWIDGPIADLTGWEPHELLGGSTGWLDLVFEKDREIVLSSMRNALAGDGYYQAVHRIVSRGGETKWAKMRGRVSCGDAGEFLHLQGVLNDISEQKNMELSLESKHNVFAWVADNLEDGIYIISSDYRIEFMNKALIDLVGDRVGDVCYRALFNRETVCPWSVMETIQRESCGFQEYYLSQLGKTFQVRSFPIKGRDGSVGKLAKLKDVTTTLKLQGEVIEFEARQKAIADAADMANLGIFILQDREGTEARFRYTNEAFCKISGYSSEELLSKSAPDIIHPDDVREAMQRYRRRQGGEILNQVYEMKLLRKDGASRTAFFSVAPSQYEGKFATVGFVRDITERKRVQQSLWMSQRLASIRELAAGKAPEINNPLTSVLTFSKLVDRIMRQEPFPAHRLPELRQYMSFLEEETSRCAEISRNLLDFSRHGDIEIKENDIHDILRKTLDILKHRAEMSQIRMETAFAEDVPLISCDYKRIQQAFINLFWNGIEAMPEGGTLSVETTFNATPEVVEIRICDTGHGIPEENLERIFEPFFTTKSEAKGVGLGLSVAYGIIKQHKGHVRVSSEVGKGTCFSIQLRAHLEASWVGESHVV